MLHWKYSTLTSLIVLGWLTNSYSLGPEDLPGFSEENAIKANPGAVILMDTYESDSIYYQDRADDIGPRLRANKADVDIFLKHLISGSLYFPKGPGFSWLYGIAPDTDWRAAFNSSQAMQEAFKAIYPDPDQLDPFKLETIKAVFSQEWIIASQYQTAPLEGDFTGHKTHLHDLAKNIHRLLPEETAADDSSEDNILTNLARKIHRFLPNKKAEQDNTLTWVYMILSISPLKYVKFIDAVEGQLTDDMDNTQRQNYMASVKLLSEEDDNYEKAVQSLAAVPKSTLETIHIILAELDPEARDGYLTAVTPLFTDTEGHNDHNILIAEEFAHSVTSQDAKQVSEAMLRLRKRISLSSYHEIDLIERLSRLAQADDLDSFVAHLERMPSPETSDSNDVKLVFDTFQSFQSAETPQALMNTVEPFLQNTERAFPRRIFFENYRKIIFGDYQVVADFINDCMSSNIPVPSIQEFLEHLISVIHQGETLREYIPLLREILLPDESGFSSHLVKTNKTFALALAHIDSHKRASFVQLIKSLFNGLTPNEQRILCEVFGDVTPQNLAHIAQTTLDIEKQTDINRVKIAYAIREYLGDERFLQKLEAVDFRGMNSSDFHNFLTSFEKPFPNHPDNCLGQVNESSENYRKSIVDDYQVVADFINDWKSSSISAPSIQEFLEFLISVIHQGETLSEFIPLLREIPLPEESGFSFHLRKTYKTCAHTLAHIDSPKRASFVWLIKSLFNGLTSSEQRVLFGVFGDDLPPIAQAILDIENQTGMKRVKVAYALREYLDDGRFLQRLKDIDFRGLDCDYLCQFLTLFAKLPADQLDNYIDQVNKTYLDLGESGDKIPLSWAFLRIAPDNYEEFRQNVTDMKDSIPSDADFGLTDYADYLSRVPMHQQKEFNTLIKNLGSELKNPYTKSTMEALAGKLERGRAGIPPSQDGDVVPTLKKVPRTI